MTTVRLRWAALRERARTSLFLTPMLAVVAAVALGLLGLQIDSRFGRSRELPLGLASTVESAREVLATVASATITFAGIAFSVSLLVIQQASNQYSPRIVHTLFRDPYNRRAMAFVVGTFTYCLVVLRSVRTSVEVGGEPVIPHLSVAVAVLLGVLAVLSVVAYINHSAHSMDVSEILQRAKADAVARIDEERPDRDQDDVHGHDELPSVPARTVVRFDRSGWVQQVDEEALLDCLPAGADMELRTHTGRYAVEGTVLCVVSTPLEDRGSDERAIRRALTIGSTRTTREDPSYGIRQLVDVALKALSPGVNDPTTAQDAIFHVTAVLAAALSRPAPAALRAGPDGRRLVLPEKSTDADLIGLAYDEVRRVAAPHPTVCIYLLESLALLDEVLDHAPDGQVRRSLLRRQAELVVAGCESADVLPEDLELVRRAHRERGARRSEVSAGRRLDGASSSPTTPQR